MYAIYFALGVLTIANTYMTIRIAKRCDFEPFQKVAQSLFVWLIPVLGIFFIWIFYKSNDEPTKANISSEAGDGVDNYNVGGHG